MKNNLWGSAAAGTAMILSLTGALMGQAAHAGEVSSVAAKTTNVVTLDSARSTSRPDVVVDPGGTVTVVWSHGRTVLARSRVGSAWEQPVILGHGRAPQVGVTARGTLTVIWLRHVHGYGPQVMASRHPVSGAGWTRPKALSAPAPAVSSARGAYTPTLAVSDGGAMVVSWLWNQEDSGAARVQARFWPPGGPWQRIATLSPPDSRDPVATIDGDGRATIVYAASHARPYVARHTAGGWTDPARLSTHGVDRPQVASGAQGDVVATFAALVSGAFQAQAADLSPGGGWSSPAVLEIPTPPTTVDDPVVGLTARGTATAVWWRSDQSLATADHQPGGSWTAPSVVVPAGPRIFPEQPFLDLALSPRGAALLTWTTRVAGKRVVNAGLRNGGTWSLLGRVSPSGSNCYAGEPAVRAGAAVLAWRCSDASGDIVQVAGLTG